MLQSLLSLIAFAQNALQGYNPALSADGKQITFVSNRDGTSKLCLMDIEGRDQRAIADGVGRASSPAWSPDGDWVYFIDTATDALMAMRPDSQDLRTVFQDASITALSSPAWTPGGH